ncbi:uncharacterized protein VTP21DRAFT_6545 [Calcarisporiella thermophila]|uniref:uncharacterized protein n=1 Tax=Calcarisporiella thermophila TaxID=911321 RepID=UPI003743AC3B
MLLRKNIFILPLLFLPPLTASLPTPSVVSTPVATSALRQEPSEPIAHQLAVFLSTHYHEHFDSMFTRFTQSICDKFGERIYFRAEGTQGGNTGPLDESGQIIFEEGEEDIKVLREQVLGGVETFVKDEIPIILSSSSFYSTSTIQLIEDTLYRYCPSSSLECLESDAAEIMSDLDTLFLSNARSIVRSIHGALPWMWRSIKRSVQRVVTQVNRDLGVNVDLDLKEPEEPTKWDGTWANGESEMVWKEEFKHHDEDTLVKFIKLVEERL